MPKRVLIILFACMAFSFSVLTVFLIRLGIERTLYPQYQTLPLNTTTNSVSSASATNLNTNEITNVFNEPPPKFSLDKNGYYRYETVRFEFKHPNPKAVDKARVLIYRNNRAYLSPIYGKRSVNLIYNEEKGAFEGRWYPSINPPLGGYQAVLLYEEGGEKRYDSSHFYIKGRHTIKNGSLAVVTLEALGTLKQKEGQFLAPNLSRGGWTNLIKTARFMGADMFAACVGETAASRQEITASNVWVEEKLDYLDTLAEEAKREGLDFGAWIHAFFIQLPNSDGSIEAAEERAANLKRLGYKPSLKYERDEDLMLADWHCSLSDEKRVSDITKLASSLQKDNRVDYIGLDYIRSLHIGGMEMVEDFVKEMEVETPKEYGQWSMKEKMRWLNSVRDKGHIADQWRYYKAQIEARVVASVKKNATITKPMWVFNLGWHHGWEHGQDPLMFLDAGADYDFIMLYEIAQASTYDVNIDKYWKGEKYASGEDLNAIVGNTTIAFHNKNTWLNPVEEYNRRTQKALSDLYNEGNPRGVFFHDLWRANFAKNGEFSYIEWIVAGGKSFSDLRSLYLEIPLSVHIDIIEIPRYNGVRVDITVGNINSSVVSNIIVQIINTPSLKMAGESATINSLVPDQSQTVSIHASINNSIKRDFVMIPVLATWSTNDHRKRIFEYKYIRAR